MKKIFLVSAAMMSLLLILCVSENSMAEVPGEGTVYQAARISFVSNQGRTYADNAAALQDISPQADNFYDVPTGYWAYDFIYWLYDHGITSGCGSGNYCPEDPVTRGQMAVFILKTFGQEPAALCEGVFNDVSPSTVGDDFCRYIEKMASLGITSGCGNNNYCPDDPVTRGQMAVFLTRALYQAAPFSCAGTIFGDVNAAMNGGESFCEYIEKFAALGITSGCGAGSYCPDDPVTRAQMAVFLARAAAVQYNPVDIGPDFATVYPNIMTDTIAAHGIKYYYFILNQDVVNLQFYIVNVDWLTEQDFMMSRITQPTLTDYSLVRNSGSNSVSPDAIFWYNFNNSQLEKLTVANINAKKGDKFYVTVFNVSNITGHYQLYWAVAN